MTWAPPGGGALVPESRHYGGLAEPCSGSGVQGFTTIEFPEEIREPGPKARHSRIATVITPMSANSQITRTSLLPRYVSLGL